MNFYKLKQFLTLAYFLTVNRSIQNINNQEQIEIHIYKSQENLPLFWKELSFHYSRSLPCTPLQHHHYSEKLNTIFQQDL